MSNEQLHRDIGRRLRLIREKEGMTVAGFSEKHGFNRTQYTNWESGTRQIPIQSASKLLFDGMTLDFIYLGRDWTLSQSRWTALFGKPVDK